MLDAKKIQDALLDLPYREWAVLEMKYQRGGSLPEIARWQGVTPSRIFQLRERALAKVRRKLVPEETGEGPAGK